MDLKIGQNVFLYKISQDLEYGSTRVINYINGQTKEIPVCALETTFPAQLTLNLVRTFVLTKSSMRKYLGHL